MSEQTALSLFDFAEPLQEEITSAREISLQEAPVEVISIVPEQVGQEPIFEDEPEIESNEASEHTNEAPYIGQKAKIVLPEDKDSEVYLYLSYYFKHLINRVGEISDVKLYPSGKYTCTVNVFGEEVVLNAEDLNLL